MKSEYAKAGWELRALGKVASDGSLARMVFLVGEGDFDKAVEVLRAHLGPDAHVQSNGPKFTAGPNLLARLHVLPGTCAETWPYSPLRRHDA